MKHPSNRAERRRSVEAKALERFVPKKVNAKKRAFKIDILDKETSNELHDYTGL